VALPVSAPQEPGTYLVVLDIVTPAAGSLVALGNVPGMLRVIVVPPEPGKGAEPR
jgi:hypothetical protein